MLQANPTDSITSLISIHSYMSHSYETYKGFSYPSYLSLGRYQLLLPFSLPNNREALTLPLVPFSRVVGIRERASGLASTLPSPPSKTRSHYQFSLQPAATVAADFNGPLSLLLPSLG